VKAWNILYPISIKYETVWLILMQHTHFPDVETTQAAVDRIKQRIHNHFPYGSDRRPVMRAFLNIQAFSPGSLVINGNVDTTAAEVYERFSNLIRILYIDDRAKFGRTFQSDGPALDRYVTELINLLDLQKYTRHI
jgi:hypothetical protein